MDDNKNDCNGFERFGVQCYLSGEDDRYPTLILEGEFGSIGYALNKRTGELSRACICSARCSCECCCGAWD